jgi:fumarate reductase flavoprotein subunit
MKFFSCLPVPVLCLLSALLIFFGCKQPESESDPKSPPEIRYRAGTYSAAADGYDAKTKSGLPVAVSAEFSQSAIISVDITSHNESTSRETVRKALASIPRAIVQNQSAEVDTVTGATYTSGAIIDAVKDCMDQAALSGE